MNRQRGLSLVSTLIVGAILVGVLVLGLKVVPVYSEYFEIKKAFTKVVTTVDPSASPFEFRSAFKKFADAGYISTIDYQTIEVNKDNGKASLHIEYNKTVKLFANVSLLFEFSVDSD